MFSSYKTVEKICKETTNKEIAPQWALQSELEPHEPWQSIQSTEVGWLQELTKLHLQSCPAAHEILSQRLSLWSIFFEKARVARHFVEKSGRSLLAQKEYEDMQIDNMNKGFAEAVFKRKQPVQAPSKLCVKFHVSASPSCHRLQFLASGFRYHTEAPACYNRARQHSKCPNSSLHTSWTANCRVLSHVEVWFPQAVWIFLPITTLKVNPSNGSYNNSSLFFGLGPLVPNEQLHCEQSPAAPFGHFGFTTSCDFKLPRALRLVSSSWANLSRRAASFLAWSWPQEIMAPCKVIFLNNARRQKNLNERSHTLTSLKRRPEATKDVWKAAKRSLVLIYFFLYKIFA